MMNKRLLMATQTTTLTRKKSHLIRDARCHLIVLGRGRMALCGHRPYSGTGHAKPTGRKTTTQSTPQAIFHRAVTSRVA